MVRAVGRRRARPIQLAASSTPQTSTGSVDGAARNATRGGSIQRAARSALERQTRTWRRPLPARSLFRSAAHLPSDQPTTRYKCQRSGTPLSSCSPASSKMRPDPATRSLTVCETSTWPARAFAADAGADVDRYPAWLAADDVALARVKTDADLDPRVRRSFAHSSRATDRGGWRRERREEPITSRIDLLASEAAELRAYEGIVLLEQIGPRAVAKVTGKLGRSDDVGEHHGRHGLHRLKPTPLTGQELLDFIGESRHVARPEREVLTGQLNPARSRDPFGEVLTVGDVIHPVTHPMHHKRRNRHSREEVPNVHGHGHLTQQENGAGACSEAHQRCPPTSELVVVHPGRGNVAERVRLFAPASLTVRWKSVHSSSVHPIG